MFEIFRSSDFDQWLTGLRDAKSKARILLRLRQAASGHFGDCNSVGDGISEMRVHIGPGYRIYFMRTGSTIYLLLTGGDKDSQSRDIARAKELARIWREENQ
jgi:putative addiction module killer protein